MHACITRTCRQERPVWWACTPANVLTGAATSCTVLWGSAEDWLLGRFAREAVHLVDASTGAAPGLDELDLVPDARRPMRARHWPYVKQVYSGGDECVLSGGRRVVRRSEVRLACSPDERLHMVVREPDFCSYVFVIYVPELCTFKRFMPQPLSQEPGAGQAAGAGGGGGAEHGDAIGAGSSSSSKARRRAQESAKPSNSKRPKPAA